MVHLFALFILGIIAGVIGIGVAFVRDYRRWGIGIIFLGLILIGVSCLRVVPPGNVGVQVVFGKVNTAPEATLKEGLHFLPPWISVKNMSIRIQEYTMSNVVEEGEVRRADAIPARSKDGLELVLDLTVRYQLKPEKAAWIYQRIGGPNEYKRVLIRPTSRTVIRNVVAQYSAEEVYGSKREEVQAQIFKRIKEEFEPLGFICHAVLLRNVDLPDQVEQAIQQKIAQQETIERKKFEVEVEKQEAERKRIEAQALAEAQQIIAGSLTAEYLQWYYIATLEKLINSPNNTVLILPMDKNLVPMLTPMITPQITKSTVAPPEQSEEKQEKEQE